MDVRTTSRGEGMALMLTPCNGSFLYNPVQSLVWLALSKA